MIILKSWLQDYIEIPYHDVELIDRLTSSGSLVDSYYQTLDPLIVIAEILEINPHPNADKLQLAKVSDGLETYNVVCGAPNIALGQRVPLAKVGAKVSDFIIKEAIIRGQKSSGMLCSEQELGIGTNHEGILILDPSAKLGDPISSIYGSELILDLEITPNRGDCLSHYGMAREVAAILGRSISKKPLSLQMSNDNVRSHLNLDIRDDKLCHRYYARIIKNLKVAPSPDWLQKRLVLAGIKPINNIVDVTNYIMIDLGQPLHAFDAKKINGNTIEVRKAKKGEQIVTIDAETRALDPSMLVIADNERPIAIAGVMGGYESQIEQSTTDVVLEAAEFQMVSIRKTSKSLGLSTDASYRFERGIDPAIVEYAINKAAKMLSEIAGGTILSGLVKFETPRTPLKVPYKVEDINNLLGTSLKEEEIANYLRHLGFSLSDGCAEVPSWRHDIAIWQDLAEEVVRLYGLDNIKHQKVPKSEPPKKSAYYYKEHLKDLLVECGYSEIYGYSFMSEQDIAAIKIAPKDLLEVSNPVSPENKYMRNSLIPSLLFAVAKNPTFDPVLLFEIGNVFSKHQEATHLCIVASGSNSEKQLKVAISELQKVLKISSEESATKCFKRQDLGYFKIKKPEVYYTEIDLSGIEKRIKIDPAKLKLALSNKNIVYRTVSKYPSVTRDLAFIINKDVKADIVGKSIYEVSDLVNNVELFDEFASDKFGQDMKNLAYHIYLQAPDRTLNDEEANGIIDQVVKVISKQFKAKLRDK